MSPKDGFIAERARCGGVLPAWPQRAGRAGGRERPHRPSSLRIGLHHVSRPGWPRRREPGNRNISSSRRTSPIARSPKSRAESRVSRGGAQRRTGTRILPHHGPVERDVHRARAVPGRGPHPDAMRGPAMAARRAEPAATSRDREGLPRGRSCGVHLEPSPAASSQR